MTQSIAFIICENKKEAENFKQILEHPLYIFINNICRYGNFNNIRILQKFPKPQITYKNAKQIYDYFELNDEEVKFIENNM
jgi:hypothetical protein